MIGNSGLLSDRSLFILRYHSVVVSDCLPRLFCIYQNYQVLKRTMIRSWAHG
ncbi:MAG: hypothetical protein RMY62_015885 [Nostoc sp. ZfuVER08]|uniref:Uncharacterized protein n=1 Tax=Nostoc punctiforme FACHB-252 TaxID=1357509 RepID=A0ABR8H8K7_NOSPU|nr:hypothetical protein [Nostoc punctiforme]MBD2612093.1 hypothetical protein [Nostoc punctiforme FACHB-252]MDZ8010266.1 hypothetical protein [Nostoc sp. ZfuVER08]